MIGIALLNSGSLYDNQIDHVRLMLGALPGYLSQGIALAKGIAPGQGPGQICTGSARPFRFLKERQII